MKRSVPCRNVTSQLILRVSGSSASDSGCSAAASSRQPGGCGLSWPEITVIKTDNIIVFQVVICPVQLNPVNENLPLKEANFPAMS
ncbi:hypothetical protein CRD97_27965 [Escherichia coli]|nr:hypothetical protein CRD97_27965 [Escherichia coli]